jgi:hypothetical protein
MLLIVLSEKPKALNSVSTKSLAGKYLIEFLTLSFILKPLGNSLLL